jgi:hypothetical protein
MKRVKWSAELSHVREVSLRGSADLDFWRSRMVGEQLDPLACDGRAVVMIVAAAGKFMGIRFRELSISIAVASTLDEQITDEYFLLRAFNSNRVFACCERALFATPYEHAVVAVEDALPAAVSVAQDDLAWFRMAMGDHHPPTTRVPTGEGEETWEARIMLPRKGRRVARGAYMFFARIRGNTVRYPFLAGTDSIAICPQADGDVLHVLLESQFAAHEWIIRSNATHAKSKTYRRDTRLATPPISSKLTG